jgi:hypothetical protein
VDALSRRLGKRYPAIVSPAVIGWTIKHVGIPARSRVCRPNALAIIIVRKSADLGTLLREEKHSLFS